MKTDSNETGPDFVPLENRRPGLTIRSYRLTEDGTVVNDTGVVEVDSEPDSYAYHPAATWPKCRCPHHSGR
ncbi:hypothetical protein GCM10010430_59930 [Kitasatospora cystarginea]|uniref:Uncharacterized protein n=1 Tax=Kitasatospora cystarginea TaxID=58350 RepID=A0ABN3EQB4_9ACTN